ncbi:transcriptional regulator [Deinococcus seoulensis]|uniref:Transcriptional regulator n=1 Tax=Deinococcus seoulensis TaxID=1837379 RepID=A0ABQ2RV67_9DEIO|nr:transcriptional regulator [Deinococcus seoulensis]GGR69988.1 transcriptional regulator [Deinococcus seoulensis]
MNERLVLERQRRVTAWNRFVARGGVGGAPGVGRAGAGDVPAGVLASWNRSALTVPPDRVTAPVSDQGPAWTGSPLEFATRSLRPELGTLAREGDLMVALADTRGQLLWTAGSPRMQRLGRALNFVPGGHWDEGSVGTNALALALRERQAVRVFAAEHYVQAVHDWVCYCAPLRDARGALLGVLNLSTVWDQSTPLGLASAQHYAQRIEAQLAGPDVPAGVQVRLCGVPGVQLGGRRLHLTPRQLELLTVLALHPDGLTLDALHAHMYGDAPISSSTLKSEVSTLRGLLGGQIASRPYRLSVAVDLDLLRVERLLLSGDVNGALDLFDGPPLPVSESPLLSYWRSYLDGALRRAVCGARDPALLWRYAARFDDLEVLALLESLLGPQDPRREVVRARHAALLREL